MFDELVGGEFESFLWKGIKYNVYMKLKRLDLESFTENKMI
ncbi:hypothetical protein Q5O89_26830 [Peribacillus frigoritolerans]|nr:hypothetical protein [Peribacillus frigoritolerans]